MRRLQAAPCGATLKVRAARFTRAELICCAPRAWQEAPVLRESRNRTVRAGESRRALHKQTRREAPPVVISTRVRGHAPPNSGKRLQLPTPERASARGFAVASGESGRVAGGVPRWEPPAAHRSVAQSAAAPGGPMRGVTRQDPAPLSQVSGETAPAARASPFPGFAALKLGRSRAPRSPGSSRCTSAPTASRPSRTPPTTTATGSDWPRSRRSSLPA